MSTANLTQSGITSASPADMFDLRPSNVVTIGGSGTSTVHKIDINFNETGDNFLSHSNYMLIMGHNFEQANVRFRVQHSDSSTFADGTVQSLALTELVNIGGDQGIGVSDGNESNGTYTGAVSWNGWSLFSFPPGTANNQYWRISLKPVSGNYTTDIKIASISMGDMWSFPHAPDLNIRKSIDFRNTVQESVGGMTYSNVTGVAAPHWGGMFEAFDAKNHVTPNQMRKAGKMTYDMKFSYMTDSDIFYSELYQEEDIFTEDSFMGSVLQRTLGTHHPFLIQWDDSTAALVRDNFSWVRFTDVPQFNQVAHRVWDANVSVTEQY